MDDGTRFLYARPSVTEGVALLLDFGQALNQYNTSPTGEAADEPALRADWYAVGDDLRVAIAHVAPESVLKQERRK